MKKRILPVLLVTIGLTLLGLILFPLVVQEKYSGPERGRYMTTVKQLAMSTVLYCTDYDEVFPHASQMPGIRAQIIPYSKNSELFEGKANDFAEKQFNFNLSAVKVNAIPIGYTKPLDPNKTVVWYSLSIKQGRPGAIVSHTDGSVKYTKSPDLFEAFQYQFPRPKNALAPDDYLASEDPMKKVKK